MRFSLAVLVAVLALNAISCAHQRHAQYNEPFVSFTQLLARPELYHGKDVCVEGFLHFRYEDVALYFSREHANYGQNRSAFWLSFDMKRLPPELLLQDFDGRYVSVSGKFDMNLHYSRPPSRISTASNHSQTMRPNASRRTVHRQRSVVP